MISRKHGRIVRYIASSTGAAMLGVLPLVWIGVWYLEGREVEPVQMIVALGVVMVLTPLLSLPRALTKERLLETQRELEWLAHTDVLSGLPNRRSFFEKAREMLVTADRTGDAVAVMMIDIDRFKRINDDHGHDVGDAVIQGVAERIAAALAEAGAVEAIAARIGGEEFAIVASGIDEGRAVTLGQRICDYVRRLTWFEGRQVAPITVSVGVTMRAAEQGIDGALKIADRAVYTAKDAGRDRVEVASALSGVAKAMGKVKPPVQALRGVSRVA